jgi:hypothetical protein
VGHVVSGALIFEHAFPRLAATALLEAAEFLFESPHIRFSAALADYVAPCFPPGRPYLEGVLELVERRGSAALICVERRLLAVGARDALQASRLRSQARTAAPRAELA